MKSRSSYVGWGVEAAVLGVLVWQHGKLYEFPCFFLMLVPPLLVTHWVALRKMHLDWSVRQTLFFLTGPCVALSLSLVLCLSADLRKVAIVGGATKEMTQAAIKQRVTGEGMEQWTKDEIDRMKSERLIYAVILASTCLLYGSRLSAAKGSRTMLTGDLLLQ